MKLVNAERPELLLATEQVREQLLLLGSLAGLADDGGPDLQVGRILQVELGHVGVIQQGIGHLQEGSDEGGPQLAVVVPFVSLHGVAGEREVGADGVQDVGAVERRGEGAEEGRGRRLEGHVEGAALVHRREVVQG